MLLTTKQTAERTKKEGIVNYAFNVILPQAYPVIIITLDTVQPKVDLAQSETRHLRWY